ncbi:sulfotransferase domain-containing [Paramuricea clavata]|uniref:Sulfotransferase domain-containing n=1 Tax=Paramuricea clavata TaxID=317549 RepID=A0A6S7J0V5_PARCT|nr:sulfotransferase domain-containing [Paramuricea clavata]
MSTSEGQNPAIELMSQRRSRLMTNESRQKALGFVPRSSDVLVATPIKCGTTWIQQIMHQLRSGGDMTFTDIDEVVPWIELAYDVRQDLDAEHKYQPRCFKTHASYDVCPKGGKYIVVYREPCASLYSAFNFFEGQYFRPGEITLDEFVKYMISPNEKIHVNYFQHLQSWWPKRNDPNVLFLLYEDMLEDLESAVRAVASFMGIDDEASITNAVKMSTFDFMKQSREKFACNLLSSYRNKAMGIPEAVRLQRVATGSATKGREMMDEGTKQAVQKMWDETNVTKETGFQDYSEFRDGLKREKQS